MKGELLKPNDIIGAETNIELGKYELKLFNLLIYAWQRVTKEDLFAGISNVYRISLSDISRHLGVNKENLVRDNYLESLFENILNCTMDIKNGVLPKIDREGRLIVSDGALEFEKVGRMQFNLLQHWKKIDDSKAHYYAFNLTDIVKGLVHFQTLIAKNGVGYSKLNLKTLNTIKSAKAIRLYEVLVRENTKQRKELYISYAEMAKIIYEPNKKFRINEALKRLIPQLKHLVEIEQDKTDKDYVYLKFDFRADGELLNT